MAAQKDESLPKTANTAGTVRSQARVLQPTRMERA